MASLRALLAVILFIVCTSSVHAHEIKFGHLTIVHPWCRSAPDGIFGFMKIINNGPEDDRLIKVTAEISDQAQLRDGRSVLTTELPGGIAIPAGQTVKLTPDSLRIAFLNVKSDPVPNTEIKGTLTFERAGTLHVDFEVDDPID